MNEIIRLASKLQELRYTPNPTLYGKLLGWLEEKGLESLHEPLERDLIDLTGEDIEVPVQRLDRALTDSPLYYPMKTTDTLTDLKWKVAAYEHVPASQVRFMSVGPDVMYRGERVSGKTTRLDNESILLGDLRGVTLIAYPYKYPDYRYVQPINWTEQLTETVEMKAPPRETLWSEVRYAPSTTIGQLKLRFWVIFELHPHEQRLVRDFGEPLVDSDAIPSRVRVFARTYPVTARGITRGLDEEVGVSILDSGRDIMQTVGNDFYPDNVVIDDLWLGAPNDLTRQRLNDERDILYRYLVPHPDKNLYVDAEEEEEEPEEE